MVEKVVKTWADGLHVSLSKKEFKAGDVVHVLKVHELEDELNRRVRKILAEVLDGELEARVGKIVHEEIEALKREQF